MSLVSEWHLFIRVGELARLFILKAEKARKVWKIAVVFSIFFILANGNPFSLEGQIHPSKIGQSL